MFNLRVYDGVSGGRSPSNTLAGDSDLVAGKIKNGLLVKHEFKNHLIASNSGYPTCKTVVAS
jgi:hypothetical protein